MTQAAGPSTDPPRGGAAAEPLSGAAPDTAPGGKASAESTLFHFDQAPEHFIPLRKSDLIHLLTERLKENTSRQEQFADLCRLLESVFHFEYHDTLRRLNEDYAALDPDTALVELRPVDEKQRDRHVARFLDHLGELLKRANYRELSESAIDEAINAANALGLRLRVDFDLFDRLHVFARGDLVEARTVRRLRTLFKRRRIEIPIFQRLVVMFRLKEQRAGSRQGCPNAVYLKIFKNIPKTDLDMLLPGSKVRMRLVDQARIFLPTLSGLIISLFKVVKALAVLTLVAGMNLLVFIGLVGGTLGYGVKSVFGYLRTKDKYQLSVTRHLYFQNLDNNAGVFFRVLNEAEEQEFREAIVAYFLLWTEADDPGWTKERLDQRAEEFLCKLLKVPVDFEDDDALDKLGRLGLAQVDEQGRWTAAPIGRALQELDRAWDHYFQFHQQAEPSEPRPPETG